MEAKRSGEAELPSFASLSPVDLTALSRATLQLGNLPPTDWTDRKRTLRFEVVPVPLRRALVERSLRPAKLVRLR